VFLLHLKKEEKGKKRRGGGKRGRKKTVTHGGTSFQIFAINSLPAWGRKEKGRGGGGKELLGRYAMVHISWRRREMEADAASFLPKKEGKGRVAAPALFCLPSFHNVGGEGRKGRIELKKGLHCPSFL